MAGRSDSKPAGSLQADSPPTGEEVPKFELKKEIGVWSGVAVIAGIMVGSGIFVSPVGVLAGTNGSVGVSLILWLACGVLSALAALCYAELGTSILESGGEFAYLNAAYGEALGFMYMASSIFVMRTTGNGAKAVVFGTYVTAPFYPSHCKPPEVAAKLIGAAAILIITFVNYVSVKVAARVQIVFTTAKFVAMGIIIVGGLTRLAMGDAVGITNFQNAFNPEDLAALTASQVGLAFYQGLFSYGGWNNLNAITEEVKNVEKNLPRCIIIGVSAVTVFYFLVNVAYLSVLTPEEMLSSKAVASTFGDRVLGQAFAWIMPLSVCLSIFGSINGSALSGGRMPFVAARRGHMPQVFAMVNVIHITPGPAVLLESTLTVLMMIPGSFDTLLYSMTFTTWIFYGLCAAAVLVLRKRRPDIPRPYKVPTIIPVFIVICSLYLVIAPLVDNPDIIYVYALAFILSTPIIYYPLVYKQYQVPGIDHVTRFFQKLLQVAPTDWKKI